MNTIFKSVLAAGIALAPVAMAAPVQAQTNGIATSSPEAVLVKSQALQSAYSQINSTYSAQGQQVATISNEIQTLQKSLDTNGDNQVTEAELRANPGVTQQIQQKQQQLETTLTPVILAQAYAIEQLLREYSNAQQQVVQQKNIQLMMVPDAFQYMQPGTDVTDDIVAALNQRVPSVQTTPPANYQPGRTVMEMHSTIQQLMGIARQRQQAQQQQQPQSSGR